MGKPCHNLIWKQLGGDASFQGDVSCITWQEVLSRTGQKKQRLWHTWKVMATLKIPCVNCKCGFQEFFFEAMSWTRASYSWPLLSMLILMHAVRGTCVRTCCCTAFSLLIINKKSFFKCDFLPEIITHLSKTLHLLIMHPCLWFVSRHLRFSF